MHEKFKQGTQIEELPPNLHTSLPQPQFSLHIFGLSVHFKIPDSDFQQKKNAKKVRPTFSSESSELPKIENQALIFFLLLLCCRCFVVQCTNLESAE